MSLDHPRMARAMHTLEAMIGLYCRAQHGSDRQPGVHAAGLCADCQEILAYARARLTRCPFQEDKTTCARCPVHCYKPAMRERIRAIMRYAGPRMIYHHPVLAIRHLLDGRREAPRRPVRKPSSS